MRIALDAMGGDYAPDVNIQGAIETVCNSGDIDIILVGDESDTHQGAVRTTVSSKQDIHKTCVADNRNG